jgi:hypothetical protein
MTQPTFTQPLLPRHPWVAALLLGTVATPAGIVLGWLAPRPFDAVVALPLVLMDIWAGRRPGIGAATVWGDEATLVRLLALVLGIALTWLLYVIVARVLIWRLGDDGDEQ